jgi:hypothetical protein
MLKNGIIWILGILLAVSSGLTATGAVSKDRAPYLATKVLPLNGFALENLASAFVERTVAANMGRFSDNVDSDTMMLAEEAFHLEPVTPGAVAVLALGSPAIGKSKLMQIAFDLSRREKLVNGWMIVDCRDRNDIEGLLYYYDTTLRVSRSAASAIIPAMVNALSDERFIEPAAKILSGDPPWAIRFWRQIMTTPRSLSNAASLRAILFEQNQPVDPAFDNQLIMALVNQKLFKKAETLFLLFSQNRGESQSFKNGAFHSEASYAPFDWQVFTTGKYGATIEDNTLFLNNPYNSSGVFSRQFRRLPPAQVKIRIELTESPPEDSALTLSLDCAEEIANKPREINIPIIRKMNTQSIDNSKSGCNFYWLKLATTTSKNERGFEVAIKLIAIEPL